VYPHCDFCGQRTKGFGCELFGGVKREPRKVDFCEYFVGGTFIEQFLRTKTALVKWSMEPVSGVQVLSKSLAEQPHPPRHITQLSANLTNAYFVASYVENFSFRGRVRIAAGGAN